MDYDSKFQIKYWGNDDYYQEPPKRSIKKKLIIVSSFVGILAIIPVLVYGLSYLDNDKEGKITAVKNAATTKEIKEEPTLKPTATPSKAPQSTGPEGEYVINNDSYWKISKRHCGTGIYYLSIREQNGGKALYQGDFVPVTCR